MIKGLVIEVWQKVIIVLALVLPFSLFGLYSDQQMVAVHEGWEYEDNAVLLFSTAGCAKCKLLAPEIIDYCEINSLELIEYDLNTPDGLIRMYALAFQ